VTLHHPIRLLLVTLLASIAITGCDNKPSGLPKTAAAQTPANGKPADLFHGGTTNGSGATNDIPLQTIASLSLKNTAAMPDQWVQVRGMVLDESPGNYLVVNDGTGTVFAETLQAELPPVRELVEVRGQLSAEDFSVRLKNAVVTPLSQAGTNANALVSTATKMPVQLPILTQVWEIRDLPPEKAAWHYPVHLHALVTVNVKANHFLFVQDNSMGISVELPAIPLQINPGDRVDITGVSDPGWFSPIVLASNITVTGQSPLPKPQPTTTFQLANGQEGSQWIELRGVVHSLTCSNGMAHLNVQDQTGKISVNVPADDKPEYLLDAIVRLQGACGSRSDKNRQFAGLEMWVSSLHYVVVDEPGRPEPASLPAQPITSLGEYHPLQTLQHRINLAGTVTYAGQDFFFIQNGKTGIRVNALVNHQLQPGDYVMAAGYPGPGDYGYWLDDAVFKRLGHADVPPPRPVMAENPVDPQLQDLWVRIQARLIHLSKIGPAYVLTLQTGNRIYDARMLGPVSNRIKQLEPGSVLEITGIYRLLMNEERVPKSLQLAVPSENDITILEQPSWWNVQRMVTTLGIMGIIIGGTVLWVITLRRRVQEQTASLQKSEHQFRSLVEQTLAGVTIIQDGRFVYANPRLAEMYGYTVAELTGTLHLDDVILPEDRAMVHEQIRRRTAHETDFAHYVFRARHKDGTIIQLEVHGSRTDFGGRPAVLGMVLDVTERLRSQAKIQEQARMLDLASDAIVVWDLSDRILYWNQQSRRIFQCPTEDAIGAPALEKLRIPPEAYQKAKTALLQEHQWHGEFSHRNAHGEETIVASRWTLVPDAAGRPVSILAINTDITQSKKLETQFLRAQRLESIGVLASGIAHDLNNTIAPILVSCELLGMNPDEAERKFLTDNIATSTERAANLVKQILTFARGTDGRHLPVKPRYLLEELRKILRETLPKSIQLQINNTADVWMVAADSTQVHQVLMNLCINARDAMPRGGELKVAVANLELDADDATIHPESKPGQYVIFSVSDTGTGMTPEIRERIFDPFFTTKAAGQGTGLGLSTSMGIIKSHGGFIHVHSEPNQGSCFKVYLPALPAETAPVTEEVDFQIFSGKNELLLVVDDEPSIRNIARRTLQMFGYRVITANNGEEAIHAYRQQPNEIALVLIDMMMPIMDGPAAIEHLTQSNPDIKIIAASGLTSASQVTHAAVRAFLPKPYSVRQLLQACHEVLHTSPGTNGAPLQK
jgi:two-component system cell cycle sensor histidine kinase/response regulator CckA